MCQVRWKIHLSTMKDPAYYCVCDCVSVHWCVVVMLQYYGFILYRHIFKKDYMTGPLSIPGIRDRGYVLINDVGLLYNIVYLLFCSAFWVTVLVYFSSEVWCNICLILLMDTLCLSQNLVSQPAYLNQKLLAWTGSWTQVRASCQPVRPSGHCDP